MDEQLTVVPDDARQIRSLIFAYAERLDRGDFDGVAALFEEATFGSSRRRQPLRGSGEVRGAFDRVVLYEGCPRTKHLITNVTITWGANDRATAQSTFTVLQATPGLPLQPILAGRYHDRFTRNGRLWRFSDRVVFADLVGDLGHHMSGEP